MYQHFKDILDTALQHDDYFKIALAYGDSDYMEQDYLEGVGDIQVRAGATRFALIDPYYDWICKADYSTDARGAVCARELSRYEAAKKFGVADLFTPVVYLGTYKREYVAFDVEPYDYDADKRSEYDTHVCCVEFDLYGYKKAEMNVHTWHAYRNLSDDERNSVDVYNSPLMERSSDVGAVFLRDYGLAKFNMLDEFCRVHHINDLHGGNIGILDGKIVLVDYAGYYNGGYSYEDDDSSKYES